MTNKAFKEGLAIFTATFSAVKSDTKTHKVWFMLLKDLTDNQFLYAVTKICRERTSFFPSDNFAGLIREQLKVDVGTEALMAWDAVKKAMANKGPYCSVKFSDPVIHSVVKIMASGWAEFCEIPCDKWMQKEFERNYVAMANRKDHPEYLKGIHEIENTANKFLDFVKPPSLIETDTGKQRQIGGHSPQENREVLSGDNNVMRLAEGLNDKLKVNN